MRSGMLKWLIILNAFFFGMSAVAGAGKSLANGVGKWKIIGPPLKWLINAIFTPFRALGNFKTVILVIDAVLLLICIILAIVKRKKQKAAEAEVNSADTPKEQTKALTKVIKAFR